MYTPVKPNTTLINKKVIYSDKALNLDDIGTNIKINSISNVSECLLDSCLKTILMENPKVVFTAIQYSKENQTVYFYTNEEISTKSWKNEKMKEYRYINNNIQVLEEIKKVFSSKSNNDINSISLYDVFAVMKQEYYKLIKIENLYNYMIKCILKETFSMDAISEIYGFDYTKNELKIGFSKYWANDCNEICFSKKDGNIYITKSEDSCSNEILDSIGDVLSRLYDEYIELKDFSTQFSNNIKSINSNFLVNITSDDINVHMNSKTSDSNKDFSLLHSVHNSDKYKCKCNSSLLFDVVNNNEDQIFRKIFVRIEDCPEWMRDLLYKIRKKQVEYQTIEEKEEQKEQLKKQKRLELKNKFFPFIKK